MPAICILSIAWLLLNCMDVYQHNAHQPACCICTPTYTHTLRYNTKFITDPDREYAIGQVNSQDKKNRLGERQLGPWQCGGVCCVGGLHLEQPHNEGPNSYKSAPTVALCGRKQQSVH